MADAKHDSPAPETAKQTRVLIGFLLDETGSMERVKQPTLSGFNEYIGSLKRRTSEDLRFTLTLFNSERTRTLYKNVPIGETVDLNSDTYQPNHNTPLYDALAAAIHEMDGLVDAALREGSTADILFVIMTDGEENASRTYQRAQIADLIKARQERGWTFVFLGSNQDAWAVGGSIGVAASHSMKYEAGSEVQAFSRMAAKTHRYMDVQQERAQQSEQNRASGIPSPAPAAPFEFFDDETPEDVLNPNDADLQRQKQADTKRRGQKPDNTAP